MEGLKMFEVVGDKRVISLIGNAVFAGCVFLLTVTLLLIQTILICLKFDNRLTVRHFPRIFKLPK